MNENQHREVERRFWRHYGASPTERWLGLRRPETKVRVQEIGEGPPLLFVHGGPAAGSIFAPLASHLTDFRCILLDRPGCGLSPGISYKGTDPRRTMSDILQSCVDALGFNQVDLVTSSFGGTCALWFAQRHPDRVSRMAHMGCPAYVSQMQANFMLRALATPVLGYVVARLPMTRGGVVAFMKLMGEHRLLEAGRVPEAFVDWWISLAQDTDTMKHEREAIRRGLTWKGMRPELVIADETLQAMKHPMLFYWGEDDPFAPKAFGVALTEGMSNATLAVVGAGHLPWFSDGADAAARTRAFLSEET